jgi:hypothetical protein
MNEQEARDGRKVLMEKHGLTCHPTNFSPPAGWLPVIDKLLTDLAQMDGWDPSCVGQIKEKFGGLRCYAEGITTEMRSVITAAETEIDSMCEGCGTKEGVTHRNRRGWVGKYCDPCDVKHCSQHQEAK